MLQILFGIPPDVQEAWLQLLELNKFTGNMPSQLSSGMKRKLCFMMASISNPLYKFLDEPTTGLDPMARKRFREIVDFQKNCYGSSSIITTHTMNEAEKACDKLVILVNGKILVIDSVENLKNSIHGYTLTIVKNSPMDVGVKMIPLFQKVFPEV